MPGKTKTNVFILGSCQALTNTANVMLLASSGLAGLLLTTNTLYANLPLSLQFFGTALTAVPASHYMARRGRRAGFIIGAVCGVAGGLLSAAALFYKLFWLFGIGALLIGAFNGFSLYLRFAAAETASAEYRSRAISLVLAGGVLAALVGPELAKWSRDAISGLRFSGTYLVVSLLPAASLLLLSLLNMPAVQPARRDSGSGSGRPLLAILRQPVVAVAVLAGMASYGVMAFLMTATPLAMHAQAHTFGDTAFVIQWHVLGMFAPSFVTGHLIKRFGVFRIMAAGVLLNLLCVATNLSGSGVGYFWVGLFCLGIGWNFLFIGATTLLTGGYRPEETAKTQAANELAIFMVMVVASMSSGTIQGLFGWQVVNLGAIPVLLALAVAIGYGALRARTPDFR